MYLSHGSDITIPPENGLQHEYSNIIINTSTYSIQAASNPLKEMNHGILKTVALC